MCELLALSARYKTNLKLSLSEFARHGGETGPHRDGWGVAFYEDGDVHLYREADSACASPWIEFIQSRGQDTTLALAHIRFATQGERLLRNTQPFVRELGGLKHTFSHNGDLASFHPVLGTLGCHRPVGDTDSELALCMLMAALQAPYAHGTPPLKTRLMIFAEFAASMRPYGPANFLYTDSEYLFVHADRRKQPDGERKPPGLWALERHCPSPEVSEDCIKLDGQRPEQKILLVASVPLTQEPWRELKSGEVLVVKDGAIVEQLIT